ncbi:MAG: PIN domain-containing protein [Actinomycetota bacterium]|nr:PIN domain-containing protein [Actinomycetota bacterium]
MTYSHVLVDTSVWVRVLRGHRPLIQRLGALVDSGTALLICGPVELELGVGRTRRNSDQADRVLAGSRMIPLDPRIDFTEAAVLASLSRAAGRPIRSPMDCLIAQVAIRHDVTLVHVDRDFVAIAEVSSLRQESWLEE